MANKNAFAFQNFDAERILQRKFFNTLNLPKDLTDKQIFESLNFTIYTPIEDAEKKLLLFETVADYLERFEKIFWRHLQKLQRADGQKTRKGLMTIYHSEGNGKLSKLINAYSTVAGYISANVNYVESQVVELRKIIREIEIKHFAKTLKRIRLARGLTQKKLAERLELSHSSVIAYENEQRQPSLNMLRALARELKVSINDLCG